MVNYLNDYWIYMIYLSVLSIMSIFTYEKINTELSFITQYRLQFLYFLNIFSYYSILTGCNIILLYESSIPLLILTSAYLINIAIQSYLTIFLIGFVIYLLFSQPVYYLLKNKILREKKSLEFFAKNISFFLLQVIFIFPLLVFFNCEFIKIFQSKKLLFLIFKFLIILGLYSLSLTFLIFSYLRSKLIYAIRTIPTVFFINLLRPYFFITSFIFYLVEKLIQTKQEFTSNRLLFTMIYSVKNGCSFFNSISFASQYEKSEIFFTEYDDFPIFSLLLPSTSLYLIAMKYFFNLSCIFSFFLLIFQFDII